MKKYLFLAVAALGLAACAEKGLDNGPANNGELEQSYVAITLAASDMNTKADDGKYEEGLDVERKVESAYVFFFKDGAPFYVSFANGTSTNSGSINWLEVDLNTVASEMPNVSDVKDKVLVLQNYKGQYPNQMLALLNWTPENKSYTLSELEAKVSQLGNDANGYVMSNAVYANAKKQTIEATPVVEANIGTTPEAAKANPVKIYVERVAAKVLFTANNGGKFNIGENVDNTVVYAQIVGFELYNDYEESYLLKRIDPTWNSIGFAWNDVDWCRSYWAKSLGNQFPNNTFAWKSDNTYLYDQTNTDQLNERNYVYCGENTCRYEGATEKMLQEDERTKVVVKAQLVDNAGEAVEIVNWYGKDYIGEGNLKIVVANTLKSVYYNGDGFTFNGLTDADLQCVARQSTSENAFEVYFQLSNNDVQKHWYEYKNGNYHAMTAEELNTKLREEVQPALVYKNGMTYYWTDIKHLGAAGSATEFGIVRNHVYKVNITGIQGFGTPVYDPDQEFVELEQPTEVQSYVSAQINILSWRVVENNYQLN